MIKSDLINKVQEKFKIYNNKDIAYAVNVIFASMTEAMKNGERIEIRGFGNFTIRERKELRIKVNNKNGI
jgi:nucleoid DNA-binding protein